jgi:hypothetical protein
MAESVADKTPTPTVTVRRHVDPPGLWIAILSCSLMLHASVFLLLRSLSLDAYTAKKTSTAIPIDFIQVRKTRNTQKAKSNIPIKTLSQPPQTPKISPQQVQPAIPIAPQQDAIAFANPRITKKTAIPTPKTNPKTKLPIKQQAVKKAPPKPQVKSQLEQQFERELAQQQRQQQLVERQRQQEIAAQQRQQQLAEQKFQRQIAEQQRQQELAEKQRQQEIAAQQRQQELSEQQRQQQLDRQQRQQELAEQKRQQEIAEQQRRADEVAKNQREVPKSSDRVTVNQNPPPPPGRSTTETTGGFWTANLSALPENVQIDLNSITGKLQSPPQMKQNTTAPNKLPLLNEKDRKLITQPIKCPVLLSIDAKGKIFDNDGIRISDDAPQKDICKRYAEKYFKQNRSNIEFIPARDKGNVPASGGLFVDLTIQPVATSDNIPN